MNSNHNDSMVRLLLDGQRRDGIHWPVSFGIPFRQGRLYAVDPVRLYDPEDQTVPLQAEVTGRWPDGSVRWLLLTAVMNMKHGGDYFSLSFSESSSESVPAAAGGLEVDEQIGRVLVDNGCLRAVIPHSGPGPLGEVTADGRRILERGGCTTVVDVDGRTGRWLENCGVTIETQGVIHSVILVEGDVAGLPGSCRCRCRLHFYAGLPLIRIEHTLINRSGGPDRKHLRRVDLDFEPADHPERLSFGHREGNCLRQIDSGRYELDRNLVEGRFHGWVQAADRLTVGMADFWQRFPASIRLNQEGVIKTGLLDDCSPDGMLFAPGEAQTRDLWLWSGGGAPEADSMMSLINQPPLLVPPVAWMCASEAFGPLMPAAVSRHEVYEQGIEAGYEQIMKAREDRDEYGYRNYGDSRYQAMPDGWLNNEYDWAHAYFLQFARTGDRRYFDLAASCARHTMDTDIIHYLAPPDDHLIGAPRSHNTDHTESGVDIGHAWLEGLFDYWALTGEKRAYEHGAAMGDFFVGCVGRVQPPKYVNHPGARRPGWGLIGLIYAYKNTGDEKYLRAAGAIVDICAREQQDDTGAWVYPGGGFDDPRFPVGKTFMVALTILGLQRYHQLTGDPKAALSLIKGVDWAVDYMWDEAVGGFRYIDVPYDSLGRGPGSSANHLMESLMYAYRLSGNRRYQYVASRTWNSWLKGDRPMVLRPSAIRDTLHYLPLHQETSAYKGTFPLFSVKPATAACVRRFRVINPDNVWLVGLNGLMMRSRDRGLTWVPVNTGLTDHFYGLDFIDNRRGWAAGNGTSVLTTEDGGDSWYSIDTTRTASSNYHHDLRMLSAETGYLCGCGYIWKTGDGGRSWEKIWSINSDGRWDKVAKGLAMAPQGEDRIWVVGSCGLALTIENGGCDFIRQSGLSGSAFSIFFVDAEYGFAGLSDGRIGVTRDGGGTWALNRGYGSGCLWDLCFHDRCLGYAVGEGGTILRTLDGAESWEVLAGGVEWQLRSVAVLSDRIALAAGDGGFVLRTEDQGRTWQSIAIDNGGNSPGGDR